jgi:hypothetical protein
LKIEIEEDGLVPVSITARNPDTNETDTVERMIDLWAAHNALWQIQQETKGKSPTERDRRVVDYLISLGFPSCSHRVADKFVGAVADAVLTLKKKDGSGTNAASPGSTASPSSASAAA